MQRHLAWLALILIVSVGCSGGSSTVTPPTNTGEPTPVTAAACTTDADCRIVADYCTGCDCRALATGEADPVCKGPGVKCIADPCMGKTAVCEAGACTAKASTP